VLRGATAALGTETGRPKPLTNLFAADPEAFPLPKHLDKVTVVEEVQVAALMERQNAFAQLRRIGVAGRLTSTSMDQTRRPLSAKSGEKTLGLTVTDLEHRHCGGEREVSLIDPSEDLSALEIMGTHANRVLHASPLRGGDILAWQSRGTLLLGYHTSIRFY